MIKNDIIWGDSLTTLKTLDCNTIDVTITSPPYFQQRNYGNERGIGNEPNLIEYINNLLAVFSECVRVTKETGTIVFNLGDKYIDGSLALLPYQFAIKAIESKQVFLINQLTWSKLNPTPRHDKCRLIQATEPFFIFAKSKNYYFNTNNYLTHLDQINKQNKSKPSDKLGKRYFTLIEQAHLTTIQKENARAALQATILAVHQGKIDSFRMKIKGIHKEAYGGIEGGRKSQICYNGFTIIKILGNKLKKDVIESPVETAKNNDHPAIYPLYIIQELIKLLSEEGGIILDPFCGSGTTCVAAKNLHRRYLGIEINSHYVELAKKRVQQTDLTEELFI